MYQYINTQAIRITACTTQTTALPYLDLSTIFIDNWVKAKIKDNSIIIWVVSDLCSHEEQQI